eukprot:TRINITY_DN5389_c0_g1_i1.p1 TRINITY_DN5389_c0_g1~~TRINITY_DN5389_c0_g1_i1.p1  ORF type:complete len:370 (-),score=11.82 TRINITY_DN5389_c0_g1_i1:104-1213(-)
MQATVVGRAIEGKQAEHSLNVGQLKRQSIKWFDCGVLMFLLPFEFVACLMGIGSISLLASGDTEAVVAILIFFVFFHGITQCAISIIDPGSIHAALSSFSEGTTDEEAQKTLSELRCTPPVVTVTAEAYHTISRGSGKDRKRETIIDHTERADFQFASWLDTTPRIYGLEKYRQLEIMIVPTFNCDDKRTSEELQSLTQQLEGVCRGYGQSVRSRIDVYVKASALEVYDTVSQGPVTVCSHNILATRSPGVELSRFWSPNVYRCCCWIWPGAGTIYRMIYLLSNRRVVYPLVKRISMDVQLCDPESSLNWCANGRLREESVFNSVMDQSSCCSLCDGLGLRGVFGPIGLGLLSVTCKECSGSGFAKGNE